MPHILKNDTLEIRIDRPQENYIATRFDWTGKITQVTFQGINVLTTETTADTNDHQQGQGLYNEFGIDTALGFEDAAVGGWFHKIGVGLLRKEDTYYQFSQRYELQPADFHTHITPNTLTTTCTPPAVNGYTYVLTKTITLHEDHFTIHYQLQNSGTKPIHTDEYSHNFIALNQEPIGRHYQLRFPFQLRPSRFIETVNPAQAMAIGEREVGFNKRPEEPFFFSNLSGGKTIEASWELLNTNSRIALRETGSFQTNKVNLWGTSHVISPELFFTISVNPNQSIKWSRSYHFYHLGEN